MKTIVSTHSGEDYGENPTTDFGKLYSSSSVGGGRQGLISRFELKMACHVTCPQLVSSIPVL